jgi:hypothetical protein
MAVARVLTDATTQARFGKDGLDEVCRHLWAVDCQDCGDPLGTELPTLWIDDVVGKYIEASLHHAGCRSPEWNDTGLYFVGGGVSWAARMVTLSGETGDQQAHLLPMLLLNPGLEKVRVERDSHGRWRVTPREAFWDAGLVPGPVPIGSAADESTN